MSEANGVTPGKEAAKQLQHLRRLENEKADALIEEYLDQVCARIRARELHPELREEIRGHIDELLTEKEDDGISPIEAARWALAQMGDADEVGGTLGQVHRPRFNWKLLLPLTAMVGLGLLALFSLGSTGKGSYSYFNPGINQLSFYVIGLVALIVCLFFDYRVFKKYAMMLYAVTVLLTILFFSFGSTTVNGSMGWVGIGPLHFYWTLIMFVLFLIALPGLFERLSLSNKKWTSLRQIGGLGVIVLPVILYIHFDLLAWLLLIGYLAAALTLYASSGGSRIYTYGLPGLFAAWMVVLYIRNDYWQARIQSVFAPHLQTANNNYFNDSIATALREGGWFGQGFGSSGSHIVYAYSDAILPYLTYSFGWIAAGTLVACTLWLIALLLRSTKKITDRYGRSLAAGLSVLLACQWIYGIGASFNLLPFTTLAMPFIGYGGSSTVIYCAVLGLIMGVYRRKDMIPTHGKQAQKSDGERLIFSIGGFELYDNREKRLDWMQVKPSRKNQS